MSLTLGLLAYAGQTIRAAMQERASQEQRQRPARERVFAVSTVPFEPGQVTPVLTTFGEIRSRRTLEVRATAPGTILTLAEGFEEGGQVAAGQLLARLDPADAQSALDVAMTDLTEARAEARDAATSLALAEEDVASAAEQLALRSQSLERLQRRFTRGIGSEDAVENAALAEASAKQSVLNKRQALAQAQARVDQAATAIARREIALAEAERRLADTEIHAEFAGTLSEVNAVEGGLVQNNERLANLVDPGALEVMFRVSAAQYARLLDADGRLIAGEVAAQLDVLGVDLVAQGRISRESAAVGEGQTGRLLFAQLDSARGFRPGDFVTVRAQEPDLRFVVSLPATAVDSAGMVLVLGEEDRLEEAEVQVLRRQGDALLVRARALRGREVVAERSPLLGAGIKVRPLRPDAQGALGAPAEPEPPQMVALTDERRARLIAFIEGNKRMPAEAKQRVLSQLSKPEVPAAMIKRIEARMGG
ncbi:Membrane fusion protein of RND family multidrug efflux pump [Candidatus Rhodobacter oscarellae]|uniref:Membrane fusion protein of RND family multidrug efflux pump n=1 Tax=Candidatus Rhodobacter oscarellae TaxID=1675527 RepID=A0A0J9GXG5_9RHOB|nr:Membrane fusion protein of RND family multidrug efflux pump [Candidatus Rhodobacter lobularis]